MRRRDWVGLLLVLLIAAGLRLYRADAVEFYHDEAMLGMLAQEMADGQTFPLQGIVSSVGVPNPPTTVYSIVPPFWFSNDPVIVTGWVILLNVVGVGLLYVIVWRQFGFMAAVAAALVYAANPWAIMYSRKLWAQDYATPFLLLALLLTQLGFRDRKRWAQALTLPVMLWGMQIHFAAWALVPLFGWLIVAGRARWHWPSLVVGALLSAAVLTPFALGIAQTLGQDPTRLTDSLAASAGRDLDGGVSPWVHWFRLLTGAQVATWMLPNEDSTVELWFTHAAMVALAVLGVWVAVRRYKWGVWGALALWLVLPPLAFGFALSDVWPHYFVPLLPGFALLIGLGFAVSAEFFPSLLRTVREVAPVLVGGFVVVSAIYWYGVLNFGIERAVTLGAGTSGYTTPATILNAVTDAIPNGVGDVVVLTRDMDIWFDSEAARWPVMLRDSAACVRALPSDGYAVYPAGRFAVITTPDTGAVVDLYSGRGERTTVENREGEPPYIVEVFDAAPGGISVQDLENPTRFDNGVLLTGYALDGGRVLLRWSLPDAPDRRFYESRAHDVQFFAHVLDASGNRVGQLDARFWQARHWCAGDTLYTWATVEGTDAAALLRVGLYRLGMGDDLSQTTPLDVLDVMGNPAGNWVDIPVSAP